MFSKTAVRSCSLLFNRSSLICKRVFAVPSFRRSFSARNSVSKSNQFLLIVLKRYASNFLVLLFLFLLCFWHTEMESEAEEEVEVEKAPSSAKQRDEKDTIEDFVLNSPLKVWDLLCFFFSGIIVCRWHFRLSKMMSGFTWKRSFKTSSIQRLFLLILVSCFPFSALLSFRVLVVFHCFPPLQTPITSLIETIASSSVTSSSSYSSSSLPCDRQLRSLFILRSTSCDFLLCIDDEAQRHGTDSFDWMSSI